VQTFRSRAVDIGRARARALATRFGRELRVARTSAGLSQEQLARQAGVSQTEVSRAELGDVRVALEVRCRLAAACGMDLGWRLYPSATVRLRDSGQLKLAQTIVANAHPSWASELERPVAPGDLRAVDILFSHPSEVAIVEVERRLVDLQAQLRAAQLKRQAIAEAEGRPVRLVIAVPDSATARAILEPHRDLLERALPLTSRRIWSALRAGEPIGGDGLLFVRVREAGSREPAGVPQSGPAPGYPEPG
jgi:transcriptional regulator with XRE-family HTH domain